MDIYLQVTELIKEHIKPSISYKNQSKNHNKQNLFDLNNKVNPLINKNQHRFRMTNKNSFTHQIKQIYKNTPFEHLQYLNGVLVDKNEIENETRQNNDQDNDNNEKVNSVTMTFQDSNHNHQVLMISHLIPE